MTPRILKTAALAALATVTVIGLAICIGVSLVMEHSSGVGTVAGGISRPVALGSLLGALFLFAGFFWYFWQRDRPETE